jgi:hypothetical protein
MLPSPTLSSTEARTYLVILPYNDSHMAPHPPTLSQGRVVIYTTIAIRNDGINHNSLLIYRK